MQAAAKIFIRNFLVISLGLATLLMLAIFLLDPYGVSPIRLPVARPIMDINQRYMYPQIARSKAFDSVVIGTSTSRLLDPVDLDRTFGGRFANLAMNAATAWEQTELARLYLRHNPSPRSLILGLDHVWCAQNADAERITFRGFPAWMYDENRWNDLPQMLSLKTLEITGRLAGFLAGLMPERMRRDGYEVFTPPETTYDLARARFHLWRDNQAGTIVTTAPAVVLTPVETDSLRFPALAWLDNLLAESSAAQLRIIAFMPVHIAAQPVPGTRGAAVSSACRSRIAAIASRHAVRVVDFSIASPITTEDSNYWDPLHYRLPIAGRIISGLKAASETGQDAPDGVYKVR
jgi:hypothetical protein